MYDKSMVLADYNDKNYDYTKYWDGRGYENESEFIALRKLLPKGYSKDRKVIDIGGGFGRLLPVLRERFGDITIFDYSQKLLNIAQNKAEDLGLEIKTVNGDVNKICDLVEDKYDCVTMIRVSHHLDDLEKVFMQIKNLLNDDGIFILEIANKVHFKSVVGNLLKCNFKYFNISSVSVATKDVTFLNHHPKYVEGVLKNLGFTIQDTLSVSNFRHPFIKKAVPIDILLKIEKLMQNIGSKVYFGPSIFYKLQLKK